jgi:biotin carboxyl carrier protein
VTDLISERPSTEDLDFLVDQVQRLVQILRHSDVHEMTLETPAFKVKLIRNAAAQPGTDMPLAGKDVHPTATTVTAPLVGTFYRAPNPGAEPFVAVGQRVEPGQVVGIVEAMKVMNEITSDVAGRVVRILVEDGQPVEFGQPLIEIAPET